MAESLISFYKFYHHTSSYQYKNLDGVGFNQTSMIKFSITIFCVGFPTLCYRLRNLFICRRQQSVCHVVSTRREDWVPLAKIITLMTLIFIGCCFMAHFDLVLRLGESLRPKVPVLETLAAEFIFHVPFIIRWVNICFLYMRELLDE